MSNLPKGYTLVSKLLQLILTSFSGTLFLIFLFALTVTFNVLCSCNIETKTIASIKQQYAERNRPSVRYPFHSQGQATEQYFPVVLFIMMYKAVLAFDSVYKILWCDHSNETSLAALLHDTIGFQYFTKIFFNFDLRHSWELKKYTRTD